MVSAAPVYEPKNFADLAVTDLGRELWKFMTRDDNLIRMETATYLERAAVEPLGPFLVEEFGDQVRDDRTKQMIGHMARQVMGWRGYTLTKPETRITRVGLFTSAALYGNKMSRGKPMRVTAEQRAAWVKNTKASPFNQWLDKQVKAADGSLDLAKLYRVAERYEVRTRYDRLNPGQQRMNIGIQLRRKVPKSDYGG